MQSLLGARLLGWTTFAVALLWLIAEIARPFQGFTFQLGQTFTAAAATLVLGGLLWADLRRRN